MKKSCCFQWIVIPVRHIHRSVALPDRLGVG